MILMHFLGPQPGPSRAEFWLPGKKISGELFSGEGCNSKRGHAISTVGLGMGRREPEGILCRNLRGGGCSEGCGSAVRASRGAVQGNGGVMCPRQAQLDNVVIGLDFVP